jgi:hypothetical protein
VCVCTIESVVCVGIALPAQYARVRLSAEFFLVMTRDTGWQWLAFKSTRVVFGLTFLKRKTGDPGESLVRRGVWGSPQNASPWALLPVFFRTGAHGHG